MANDNKKNLASSPGIANLLNITPAEEPKAIPVEDLDALEDSGSIQRESSVPGNLPIADLPIAQVEPEPVPVEPEFEKIGRKVVNPVPVKVNTIKEILSGSKDPLEFSESSETTTRVINIIKSTLPYFVIFALGIGIYFFYANDFSFTSLFKNNSLTLESVTENNRDSNLEQLKVDVADDYKVWINQFFTDVNDEAIISMDTDVSGNGLSNIEKYLLNLNPKVYSTRGNLGDGQAVLDDINPWTGKTFTDRQKQLVEKYINKELISNRITAAALTRGVTKFAQYVNTDSPYYIDPETLAQLPANSTQPTSSNPTNPIPTVSPANPVSEPVVLRNDEAIDKSKPARLDIPTNNISVPVTWTKDVKDFDADLKNGVVHYPGTAMPGEIGTAYISGHSSGYLWDKSPYKQVFAVLGQVKDGTSFTITATQNNGKTVKFNYIVERRGEFAANDQAQFVSTADSMVALSTCWPVGTTASRLVLFAKLNQIERN